MMTRKIILLLCSLLAMNSYAAVTITGTRIIYPAQQKFVTVQLSNLGKKPALVQAWLDDGNADASPSKIHTPFVISPPMARIDEGKGQTLRLTYTGEPLPTDRESIFWFNLLDIPPKPTENELSSSGNYLQIAVRSRIKLFYRPQGLSTKPMDAYKDAKWGLGSSKQLTVHNSSPYHITYSAITLVQNGQQFVVKNPTMVAPFSQASFDLPAGVSSQAATQVQWEVITDYGGGYKGSSSL